MSHLPTTEIDDKVVIELKDKMITFKIADFGNMEVDVEELMQVHVENLVADMCTFPRVLSRIGFIKAKVEDLERECKFDNEVYYAQAYEQHKKNLIASSEKATETAIDMAIRRDPNYAIKQRSLLKVQRQTGIINQLYWAATSKDRKLDSLSAKIRPEEFDRELVEGKINEVYIKISKNHFPERGGNIRPIKQH